MGVIVKQSFYSSLISYIGVLLAYLSLIIVQPLYLNTEEIGLLRIMLQAAVFFSIIFQLGTPYLAIKYYPIFRSGKNDNGFFKILLTIGAFGFLIASLLMMIFKSNIIEYYNSKSPIIESYYFYLLPLIFFMIVHNIVEQYIVSQLKTILPAFSREIIPRLILILLVLLYHINWIDFHLMIQLFSFTYAIVFFTLLFYLRTIDYVDFSINRSFVKVKLIKELLQYGIYVMLGNLGGALISTIDVLMLGSITGLSSVAIYSLAFYVATIIDIPKRAMGQITNPIISQSVKNDDFENIAKLYRKSSINQLIVGLLIFLGIWLNIDQLFLIIPKSDVFSQGKMVIFYIAMGRLFDLATGLNVQIISNSKHYRFFLYAIVFMAIITIGSNYIFIPIWGIVGAAFATMITLLLFNTLLYLFVLFKFKIQPFTIETIKVIFISLVCYTLVLQIPDFMHPVLNIFFKSSVLLIIYLPLIYYFKLSEDINNLMESTFIKIKNKANGN